MGALALVTLCLAAAAMGEPIAVGPVGFTVSDAERSVAFLRDVLTFQKIADTEEAGVRVVEMRLGEETLRLTQYRAVESRPIPADSRSNDRWFQHVAIVVRDMDAAYARLREHGVRHVSIAPQTLPEWNQAAAGIRAFYFRDPNEHNLEIIWFPTGKGDPRWQRKTDALFLGIDHTAIVVADTDASLRFYRDTLGLRVIGGSENYGPEQERLNDVVGARVRITSLRAPRGPGIEFLEYLAPRDGRAFPADTKPSDLVHWETVVVFDSPSAPRLLRDPDGHAVKEERAARRPSKPDAAKPPLLTR